MRQSLLTGRLGLDFKVGEVAGSRWMGGLWGADLSSVLSFAESLVSGGKTVRAPARMTHLSDDETVAKMGHPAIVSRIEEDVRALRGCPP